MEYICGKEKTVNEQDWVAGVRKMEFCWDYSREINNLSKVNFEIPSIKSEEESGKKILNKMNT